MNELSEFFEKHVRLLDAELQAVGFVSEDAKIWSSVEMRGDNETVTTYLFRGKPILQTRLYWTENGLQLDISKPE